VVGRLDFHRSMGYTPTTMKISDITILKNLNPIVLTSEKEISEQTWIALGKVLNDDKTYVFIEDFRKSYGLPENGLDITKFVGKNFKELGLDNYLGMGLLVISSTLSERTGLGNAFNDQMLLLLYFNAFLDCNHYNKLPSFEIKFVAGKEHISNACWKYPHEIGAILIPIFANKQMVLDWVGKHWEETIEKQLDSKIYDNPFAETPLQWGKIASEILYYRDKEKKKFKEISTILFDNYGKEYAVVADEDWVRAIYHQYKQQLKLWKQSKRKQKPVETLTQK